MRIAFIGGGSAVWTRNLVRDIGLTPELHGSTIVLMDIAPERQRPVAALCRRIVAQSGADIAIEETTDRATALRGADFVVVSISVGGVAGWEEDLAVPLKHGIFQTVGDTVGPGGFFRALRHIPVLVSIAQDMEHLCPEAWLINVTNPMTAICRALARTTSIRTVGLCHGVQETEEIFAGMLDVPRSAVHIWAAGLNHFLFVRTLDVDGRDGLPLLAALPEEAWDDNIVNLLLWRLYGALPVNRSRHPGEFVPYFLHDGEAVAARYQLTRWRTDLHIAYSKNSIAIIEDSLREEPQPLVKSEEVGAPLMAALSGGPQLITHVNVPNRGAMADLPAETIVEVPAIVNRSGIFPLSMADLPPGAAYEVRRVADQIELTVEAALTGDRALARMALAADALVGSLELADDLLDEMLPLQAAYLPQFAGKG
jgi:alpha-galactosidase